MPAAVRKPVALDIDEVVLGSWKLIRSIHGRWARALTMVRRTRTCAAEGHLGGGWRANGYGARYSRPFAAPPVNGLSDDC